MIGKKLSKTDEISLWWRDMWNMYHQGWVPIETIFYLMKDDVLINNKAHNTYNLFKPNNIEL